MREAADFDVRDFEDRNAGDKGVFARFFLKPVKNEAESIKEGRPMYSDKEYVEIQAAGNSTNIVSRPVTDMDRHRFARAYALFKSGSVDQVIGTRLTEVPWMTRSQCEELAYLKILTLEQLSDLNDQVCINIPGMHDLKRRAKAALESAASSAPIMALQAENETLKNELETLRLAVKEQADLLKTLQAKK